MVPRSKRNQVLNSPYFSRWSKEYKCRNFTSIYSLHWRVIYCNQILWDKFLKDDKFMDNNDASETKHIIYMFGYKFIKLVKPWTSSQRQHILGWEKSQFPCPEKKWRPIFDMAQDLQLFAKLLGRMLSFRRIPRTQCVRFSAKTTKEKKLRSFRVCQLVNGGFHCSAAGVGFLFLQR